MNKNDYLKGQCIDYTHDGQGVVKIEGFPVFVKGMIKDEEGTIKIIKVLKNYAVGRLIELDKTSPYRINPLCPLYKQCGGCTLQHMSSEGQCLFKTLRVKETLKKIGHCKVPVNDCIMMEDPWYYRNKSQVPVGMDKGLVVTGFYKQHSNDIIAMEKCYIQNEQSNKIIKRITELLNDYHIEPYNKKTGNGLIRHILIRQGYHSKEMMVVFISTTENIPHIYRIVNTLKREFEEIKTIIVNVNKRRDNVIVGNKGVVLYGEGTINDRLLGLNYKISLKSFYQINPRQVEILYQKAIEFADFKKDDVVLDTYCGIGTIGLSCAHYVRQVYGVDNVEEAIDNAKENALNNHLNNVEFFLQDAGEFMKEWADGHKSIDVVMVDPPRKGCSDLFLESMISLAPDRIVYISCNVATQSRDVDYLQNHGYKVEACQPVDMFPQTSHIENIVKIVKGE